MLKNHKKLFLPIFILLVSFCFLSLNYWSKDFDRKIDCIYYVLGEDKFENVEVHIVGSMKRSLILEDYFSYTIYIDGVRYPEKNHLLMPFDKRRIAPLQIYEIDFEPVNEIQSSYSPYTHNNALYIEYRYWINTVDLSRQEFLDYGIIFFRDNSFDEIIIGIKSFNENGKSNWTNQVGYEVIVSGSNLEEAKATFDKLNMKVFDENNEVID